MSLAARIASHARNLTLGTSCSRDSWMNAASFVKAALSVSAIFCGKKDIRGRSEYQKLLLGWFAVNQSYNATNQLPPCTRTLRGLLKRGEPQTLAKLKTMTLFLNNFELPYIFKSLGTSWLTTKFESGAMRLTTSTAALRTAANLSAQSSMYVSSRFSLKYLNPCHGVRS